MEAFEEVLRGYAARREGGTSERALTLCRATAKIYAGASSWRLLPCRKRQEPAAIACRPPPPLLPLLLPGRACLRHIPPVSSLHRAAALKDLKRFGSEGKRFWKSVDVRPCLPGSAAAPGRRARRRRRRRRRRIPRPPHAARPPPAAVPQELCSALEALMDGFRGEEDYYLLPRQYEELVLPLLRAVGSPRIKGPPLVWQVQLVSTRVLGARCLQGGPRAAPRCHALPEAAGGSVPARRKRLHRPCAASTSLQHGP